MSRGQDEVPDPWNRKSRVLRREHAELARLSGGQRHMESGSPFLALLLFAQLLFAALLFKALLLVALLSFVPLFLTLLFLVLPLLALLEAIVVSLQLPPMCLKFHLEDPPWDICSRYLA